GGVWPLPWSIQYNDFNHTINPGKFRFVSKVGSCDVIDEAIARYHKLAFPLYDPDTYSDSPPTLTTLTIDVKEGCNTKFPQLNMDESLSMKAKMLQHSSANEVWGALRGLETFSQLIFQPLRNQYRIRSASIQDQPRFPHRGTLIDTGRHFLSLSIILQHLDVMSQNKMNVLHWHIVDSESFPYTSAKFPDMSLKGAYTPAHIYSIADMKKNELPSSMDSLFQIRLTAGTLDLGVLRSRNLLPQCYNSEGKIDQLPNIMDPTRSGEL
ncbi:glycosyl hydrolase family 20, domain 2, partial [Ostertagia ostertagi]